MKILGIDPGTARVGYGMIIFQNDAYQVRDYGIISTEANTDQAVRLAEICQDLVVILDDFQPDLVVIEKLFFQKNVTTAMAVSEARGAILQTVMSRGIEILEISPQEVKMTVTGYGNADKKQVQHMVKMILKLDKIPTPDDAADGLALAIAGARRIL